MTLGYVLKFLLLLWKPRSHLFLQREKEKLSSKCFSSIPHCNINHSEYSLQGSTTERHSSHGRTTKTRGDPQFLQIIWCSVHYQHSVQRPTKDPGWFCFSILLQGDNSKNHHHHTHNNNNNFVMLLLMLLLLLLIIINNAAKHFQHTWNGPDYRNRTHSSDTRQVKPAALF